MKLYPKRSGSKSGRERQPILQHLFLCAYTTNCEFSFPALFHSIVPVHSFLYVPRLYLVWCEVVPLSRKLKKNDKQLSLVK